MCDFCEHDLYRDPEGFYKSQKKESQEKSAGELINGVLKESHQNIESYYDEQKKKRRRARKDRATRKRQ